jgi:hypothetical protein
MDREDRLYAIDIFNLICVGMMGVAMAHGVSYTMGVLVLIYAVNLSSGEFDRRSDINRNKIEKDRKKK